VTAEIAKSAKRLMKNLRRRALLPARFLADQAQAKMHNRGKGVRIALVSDQSVYTSEEQFAPFHAYRSELRSRQGVTFLPMHLSDVLWGARFVLAPFDVIIVKLGFRTPRHEASRVVENIRAAATGQKLIYFDGDDDLCVQWPEILPFVDLYVKKHSFREKARYLQQYVGKSNLTDYVHREFGYSFAGDAITDKTDPVPRDQLDKIAVGWNLALDRKVAELYKSICVDEGRPRSNDVVCRAGVPKDWIRFLRADIEPVLRRLGGQFRVLTPDQRVSPDVYLREMLDSKICVSPFGYGEICWRDFEAVLCGCLLIKPDMSHVKTHPDIFKEYCTYIPVRWDLSDLEEKCIYYLTHHEERHRIVSAARSVLREFYDNGGFASRFSELLSRVDISAPKDGRDARPR
jgi:hypothetical protein